MLSIQGDNIILQSKQISILRLLQLFDVDESIDFVKKIIGSLIVLDNKNNKQWLETTKCYVRNQGCV